MRVPVYRTAGCAAFVMLLITATHTSAQQMYPRPNLLAISPAGGQSGETVEVRITEHFELNHATGLVFSHPGITARQKMTEPDRFYEKPRPATNSFIVTIAAGTPPGIYEVRALSRYGATNARRFVVGSGTETAEQKDNNSIEKAGHLEIGTTVNGTFGADYDYFRIAAKKGQRLIIDCLSERIDSRGDPVLTILDANGKILRRVHDTVGRDPVADFSPPADGDYFLRVNDLIYTSGGGNGTAPYRLSVSAGPWIDFIEPRVAKRGTQQQFTLYGRNLGGSLSNVRLSGQQLEKLTVKIPVPNKSETAESFSQFVVEPVETAIETFTYRHNVNGTQSNPVRIVLSHNDLAAETEPNDTVEEAQQITAPVELYGHFDKAGDIDSFTFTAKEGERRCIQVDSQQLGCPTDVALVIQQLTKKEDGTVLVRDLKSVDDQPKPRSPFRFNYISEDPSVMFTAPADGTYRVIVRDQFGGASSSLPHAYRLSVRNETPDFRLLAAAGLEVGQNGNNNQNLTPRSCVIRRGAAGEVMVYAYRLDGYDGEIRVHAEGLPKGVTAEPAVIGPGMDVASVVIHADEKAVQWIGPVRILGEASIDGQQISRTARPAHIVWANMNNQTAPARLVSHLMVTIDEETTFPGRIDLGSKSLRMARGGKIELTAKFVKQGEVSGNIACQVYGLPSQIGRVNLSLNSNGTEAKGNLDIRQDCPPGSYSVFLRGDVNQNFRLYEEQAEAAKEDQQRIAKISQQLDQEYSKADQEKRTVERDYQRASQARATAVGKQSATQRTAQQSEQELKKAQTQLTAAEMSLKQAIKTVEEVTARLEAAADEEAKKKIQTELQSAMQAREKQETSLAVAKKQHDQSMQSDTKAKQGLVAATKAVDEADQKLKQTDEARKKAGEKQQQATKDRDLGRQKKREADQYAQRSAQVAQQRQKRFYAYSEQITLEVVPYPFTLKLATQDIQVQAGQKSELTATVEREFDFADAVTFTLQPPRGVGGLSLSRNAQIQKGQDDGKFELTAAAYVKPGTYEAEIIARIRFNNRQLEQRLPIRLTVNAAPES